MQTKTVVLLAFAASISAYNWDAELDIRDLDDYLAVEELVARAAKGGSAAQWGRRVERGTNAAGNVGTALTGVADIGNLIRGNGNGKRDLELAELLIRSPKGGRGGSAAQWGHRIERGTNAAGGVGTALSGIADVGNMIRGNGNGKRDLEFELELIARDAKGGRGGGGRGGSAAQWGHRLERGTNAAGNVGSALSGIADVGNLIRGNSKRDLEDLLFDDSELFARSEFDVEDWEY